MRDEMGISKEPTTGTAGSLRHALALGAVFLCLFAVSVATSLVLGNRPSPEVTAGEVNVEQSLKTQMEAEPAGIASKSVMGTDTEGASTAPLNATSADSNAPVLAVVIDDWGYGWAAAEDFLAIDAPLTVAVIPHLPYTERHAREAAAQGHQVILHLPMEPMGTGWDLGDGAVTTAMTEEEILLDVARAWESVPHVSGVNNHMGSKATADERVVAAVLTVVKEQGAFFLDSRTTSGSVVADVARAMNVSYLENDRFIDPDPDPTRVRDRMLAAAKIAKERGWAVAIGHVHPSTYEGLMAALPLLEAEGVRLAPLTEVLVRSVRQGSPLIGSASQSEPSGRR